MDENRLESDSKPSGVWLECKCHHFSESTWASQQTCYRHSWICQFRFHILGDFGNNLSINIHQIPFLFLLAKPLQKCFPNPSIPPCFLVITSRPPHVSADCGVPEHSTSTSLSTPWGHSFLLCSGHYPRLGAPGATIKFARVLFFSRENWFWIML